MPKVMPQARRFIISGTVQGVSYRANTQRKAQSLALTGWVRNQPDGTVEAFAEGDIDALDAFERWLWQGPAYASVSEVSVKPAVPEHNNDFNVTA